MYKKNIRTVRCSIYYIEVKKMYGFFDIYKGTYLNLYWNIIIITYYTILLNIKKWLLIKLKRVKNNLKI